MNNSNQSFREYLLKDRPGEESGQRAEAIITLALGFFSTAFSILAFRNPIVIITSIITNLVAIFTLVQAVRGRFHYLILFPTVTAVSILVVTTVEGDGVHDLLWMGVLGLFLLANVYSRKNSGPAILLGIFMIVLFVAAGLAEVNNILPNPFGTTAEYIVLNSFFFVTIMGAILVVFQRQRTLLNDAIKNRNEQIITNQRLEEINQTLENQVDTRTKELNKLNEQLQIRAARLQAVAEISQELLANIEEKPNELLNRAARLIARKLGFYHVGIFLIDESREFAVLRASNSKGGQQMLARRHQLKVGGTGIVGYVAITGRPRIALDTSSDVVFFNNPDLPETRSEISLPLKYGSQIIGVLDVQSMQPSAFNEDDIGSLSALASEVAIVIWNMQAAEDFKMVAAKEIRLERKDSQSGYAFSPDGSITGVAAVPKDKPALKQAFTAGETVVMNPTSRISSSVIAVPVKLRDHVVGVIHIESTQGSRRWTEDEVALVQAVSDRAALALDNARLLEESQRRAAKEHLISDISTKIGAGTDVEAILRTAVRELGAQISGTQVTVEIGGGEK